MAAEEARAAIREEFHRTTDPKTRVELLTSALGHLDRQLDLVRRRRAEVEALERDLDERRSRVEGLLASERSELSASS